ncbi:MAG TPA: sigma-70 family RNA polymerase sigma factor [Dongiaceae bacterium]|nr:sigma-70 family RNA polymerase sigma factor [Dongiaceae bacterium]
MSTPGADAAVTLEFTRRLAAHDEAAFREFHARYFDRLYQFLLVVARGQEHEAREALQETLLRVARKSRAFAEEEAFWCWLKTVARNAARDAGRKHHRYLRLLDRLLRQRTTTAAEHNETPLHTLLEECLGTLPAADRDLVEGKYLDGAAVRELAAGTGLTEKAVESRLHRLRQQLRASLRQKLNEP